MILLFTTKKPCAGIAWLKSPVRHPTLAPFGGITRIRFKGSSNWTSQPLRLPRCVEENKGAPCKVNDEQLARSSLGHPANLQVIGGTRCP
jgi:hypothetical protein